MTFWIYFYFVAPEDWEVSQKQNPDPDKTFFGWTH